MMLLVAALLAAAGCTKHLSGSSRGARASASPTPPAATASGTETDAGASTATGAATTTTSLALDGDHCDLNQVTLITKVYCASCHSGAKTSGNFSVDGAPTWTPASAELAQALTDVLQKKSMPPSGAPALGSIDSSILQTCIKGQASTATPTGTSTATSLQAPTPSPDLPLPSGDTDPFDADVYQWNHLSDPAPGTDTTASNYGDRCRAILGPIPPLSCANAGLLQLYVNGQPLTYENGAFALNGQPYTPTDGSCDNPSAAFGACNPNSRLGVTWAGPVAWLYYCRRGSLQEPDDPTFDEIDVIGYNTNTGETCFLPTDGNAPDGTAIPIPGGSGPNDTSGRAAADQFWTIGDVDCTNCHTVNSPYLVTPYIDYPRIFGKGKDLFPNTNVTDKQTPGMRYRPIDLNGILAGASAMVTVQPKKADGSSETACTSCHLLTSGQMASSSLTQYAGGGGLPPDDTGALLSSYAQQFPQSNWMPTGDPQPSQSAWQSTYQTAVDDLVYCSGNTDPSRCATPQSVLSPCPPPRPVDASTITDDTQANAEADSPVRVNLHWHYAIPDGGVPYRDDVRFHVTVDDGSGATPHDIGQIGRAALGDTTWSFSHPAQAGTTYQYKIIAERYCYDGTANLQSAPTAFTVKTPSGS